VLEPEGVPFEVNNRYLGAEGRVSAGLKYTWALLCVFAAATVVVFTVNYIAVTASGAGTVVRAQHFT